MFAPPYPAPDDDHKAAGLLVSGIEDVWDNVSPWQLQLKGDQYLTSGAYVCCVTSQSKEDERDSDVHDIKEIAYQVCDKIKFPNRIVRNDIGDRLKEQLPKLHALGYTEMPNY
jgi:phosphoribosylamine-glycine ligase